VFIKFLIDLGCGMLGYDHCLNSSLSSKPQIFIINCILLSVMRFYPCSVVLLMYKGL